MTLVQGEQVPALRSSSIRSVLVFRALKLGDMLCSVPALRALRKGLPGAEISLLGLPWASRFAARFREYIDRFIEFPGHPVLPERRCSPEHLESFFRTIRKTPPDLALQMHGSGEITNSVVSSFGARLTAGFYSGHSAGAESPFFLPYPESVPEIERNLLLVRHLGLRADNPRLEFPFLPDDALELSRYPELVDIQSRDYVCIHPGASTREKCWPIENFMSVGRRFAHQGMSVVVTGSGSESDLASKVCSELGERCIDAASPDLGIGSLAMLIRSARLLVCNDTAVSHIAAALNVPSVVIFSSADPKRWAPHDANRHRAVGGPGTPAGVNTVMQAAQALLSRGAL